MLFTSYVFIAAFLPITLIVYRLLWLTRHPRYHVHFTPTSGSWLNLVERLFGEVTERCVRRGSHTAVRALEKAMLDYLDQRNENPKPFLWTADADLILGKVARLSKRISRSGH